MRKIKRYGWKRDLPDHRDFKLTLPKATSLPVLVDLRGSCPPVYDQGQLGSCTANAIAAAFEFELMKSGMLDMTPSRLFIYFNERTMEGDPDQDNGAQIRDGMTSIDQQGVCSEFDWPYDISKFAVKPTDNCYQMALLNKAISYMRVNQTIGDLKGCLASGYPFVCGITVFESFESEAVASSGTVPLPSANENSVGGHAICCVGYDDSKSAFIFRNSWGSEWGLNGYFYLPYAYLIDQNLGSDFWTIRSVD